MRSHCVALLVFLGALALSTSSVDAQFPISMSPHSNCKSTLGVIMQSPIDPALLPVARPPAWPYCGWECAKDKALVHERNGAMKIQVVHKPIKGVTPEMLTWWFNGNVDGEMVHPVDGKTYPRYLVWHPRDHIEQRTVTPGSAPGNATRAVWSIVEFFESKDRRGYLRGASPCKWSDEFFTNVQLRVEKLDNAGLSMAFEVGGQAPMRLVHEWAASPEGLRLTSTMYVGFGADNALVAAANLITKKAFGGHYPDKAARIWMLHCLEEFSNLQHFLPALYAKETGSAAALAAAARAAAAARPRIPEPEAAVPAS